MAHQTNKQPSDITNSEKLMTTMRIIKGKNQNIFILHLSRMRFASVLLCLTSCRKICGKSEILRTICFAYRVV